LVCDATGYKAVVLASFIKRFYPGVFVMTCDARPASRLLHTRFSDRHVVLPCDARNPDRFAETLARLTRDAGVDLLLPTHSTEMDALMPRKDVFGGAMAYWGDPTSYLELHRKDRLRNLAERCAVRVPTHFESADRIRPPAVAKPVASSSAKGRRYLRSADEVSRFVAERPDLSSLVVQEYVAGDGVGYAAFARDGRALVGYGHRRLAEFPPSGGSSVYREGLEDPRLGEAAARLLAASRWSGFVMFEFKRTPQDELVLLEANPRVWGSIHQPLRAGVNMLEPLLGPAHLEARPPARTYLPLLAQASLLVRALRGDPRRLVSFARHWPEGADVRLLADLPGYLGVMLRATPWG
jgi:hypothetical protein